MPSHYAHYRFGAALIGTLPPEVRRRVQRFRQLYDVGLHGPDLFFYHNILFKDSGAVLARQMHQQTGAECFTRVCKHLRLQPSEGGYAYLCGLLAHYCLDSLCHPYVNAVSADGTIGHTELETEFDCFLLTRDGKRPAHTFDCSHHMRLTPGECVTVSEFYPGSTPGMVRRSIRTMAGTVKFLAAPTGFRRNMMHQIVGLAGDKFSQFVMPRSPNPNCSHLDGDLLALYHQALEKYPQLLEQIQNHMTCNAPLGEDFNAIFG